MDVMSCGIGAEGETQYDPETSLYQAVILHTKVNTKVLRLGIKFRIVATSEYF